MLNEGQNIMARAKVTQVMNVWQHRQKVTSDSMIWLFA
jgi:hypothetical protein